MKKKPDLAAAQSPARPEGKGPVQVESLWLDFDGTLWNNQKACVRQLEFALRVLGIDGDARSVWLKAHEANPSRALFDFFRSRKHVGKVSRKPIESWRFLRNMHEMAMRGSRPFPLLDAYAYALEYFEVAIVSSNKKKVIAKALQEHGLQDPHVYSCGKKNKRKKFARLLGEIGKPGKVLVVSDTTGDLRFADDQGIPTIGAGWGLHGAEKLRAEKLEHGLGVLDEPQELLPRLRELRYEGG